MNSRTPCQAWLERISVRMDGELGPAEGSDLDRHLASCGSCRSIEDDLASDQRRLGAALAARIERASLAGLEAAVLARVRAEKGKDPGAGGEPGRVIAIRFLAMVAAAGMAAGVLFAALPAPSLTTLPPAPVVPLVAEAGSTSPSVTIGVPVGSDVAEDPARAEDLANAVAEAEAVFILALNARQPAELASLQADVGRTELAARMQRLASLGWSNPEAEAELGNLTRNVVLLQQFAIVTPEALDQLQDAIAINGGLQSCENLGAGVSFGSNVYDANWNAQRMTENVPAQGTADAVLFWSTYDLVAAGNFAGAVAACERILAEYPDGTWADDALFKMGQVYEHHLHDYRKAIECYQRLTERYPQSRLYYGGLLNSARATTKCGDWSNPALGNYRDVEEQVAKDLPSDAADNRVYQFARSRKEFLEANLEGDPAALDLFVQAETALQGGDRERAKAILENLLSAHAGARVADEARVLLAEALRLEGRDEEALRVLAPVLLQHDDEAIRRYAERQKQGAEEHMWRLRQEAAK